MPSSVRVVFNHFHATAEKLHQAAKEIVSETADSALQRAQDTAPVDTTFMQRSGYVVTSERDGYGQAAASAESVNPKAHMLDAEPAPAKDTQAFVVFGAEHSIYVHEGTVHMGARPFLAQAVADESSQWEQRWRGLEARLTL